MYSYPTFIYQNSVDISYFSVQNTCSLHSIVVSNYHYYVICPNHGIFMYNIQRCSLILYFNGLTLFLTHLKFYALQMSITELQNHTK